MALIKNVKYQEEAFFFKDCPKFILYPKSGTDWPVYKEDRPWPASALRNNTHFLQTEVEADSVEDKDFLTFISSFQVPNLPEYTLHRELCRMNCDMADSTHCLKNGFDGKTFLLYC